MMPPNSDIMEMMSLLNSPDGIKDLMMAPMFETDDGGAYSQADMLCDVVNSLRMDAKMQGRLHGVEVSIQQCTPEKMAHLLQQMIKGQPGGIIELFNGLEAKHHQIFEEVMDDEEYARFAAMKQASLYTERSVQETKDDLEGAQADALEGVDVPLEEDE